MFSYSPKGRLKMIVLWLLSESPKKGIEIIDDISKMTWGMWRPSPSSIYPILASLEEEKMIEKTPDGKYKLTDKGIEEISDYLPPRYKGTIDTAVEELESLVDFFEDIGKESLIPYKDRISTSINRLQKLIE
ncbi:PadR family transcriptional regulator [Acidianus manzaensis]|uniref:PadR family transcriptional regulator n=1 Tax=Acidianus manzaensis TaxID=282676 RepID=A0A1W6K3S7_9CREN|nr:PadR family transcriptional regulator [Acidianus manzaensis]ARM77201.1 PadR family transcriptional regulator [Acidianus manzaensis]